MRELTDAEHYQLEADIALMRSKVTELVNQFKSSDMDTNRIEERSAIVAMSIGVTRTTTLACATFTGLYSAMVGLSKDQVVGLISEMYDYVAALPSTKLAQQRYVERNSEAVAAKHEFKDLPEGVILAPMPGMKQ